MSVSTLCGWTLAQWREVAEWADTPLNIGKAMRAAIDGGASEADRAELDKMLDLRCRWLNAGGPESGPSGKLVLKAA